MVIIFDVKNGIRTQVLSILSDSVKRILPSLKLSVIFKLIVIGNVLKKVDLICSLAMQSERSRGIETDYI